MKRRTAALIALSIAVTIGCTGLIPSEDEPDFDNSLAMRTTLPPATHAVSMPLSAFLVPYTGLDEEGRPSDMLSPEQLSACVEAPSVHDFPLSHAVLEIDASHVAFSGDNVLTLDQGLLPAEHVQSGVVEPVLEALNERLVAAKRWESQGCAPWGQRELGLLVVADPAVPAQTVHLLLRSASLAGFKRFAIAVDGPGAPGSAPAIPAEPAPSRLTLNLLPGGMVLGVDSATVEDPLADAAIPCTAESCLDGASYDWAALAARLQVLPEQVPGNQEILLRPAPALPWGAVVQAVDTAAPSYSAIGLAWIRGGGLTPITGSDVDERQLAPEDMVSVLWTGPQRYAAVVPSETTGRRVRPRTVARTGDDDQGTGSDIRGDLVRVEPEAQALEAEVGTDEVDVADLVGDAPDADDLFGGDEVIDIGGPVDEPEDEAEEPPLPQGTVIIDTPRVYGALDKAEVGAAVRREQQRLLTCYGQGLASRPRLSGSVKVHYVVAAGGSIKSADMAFSTLKNNKVESCLVQAFEAMSFPDPGGDVEVFHKLTFQP